MKSSTLFHHHILLAPDSTAAAVAKKVEEKKPEAKEPEKKDAKEAKPKDELETLSSEELAKQQKEFKEISRGKKADKKTEKVEKVEEKKAEPKPEPKAEPVEKKPEPEARKEPVVVPPPIGHEPEDVKQADTELKSTVIELKPADKRKLKVIQQMELDGTVEKGHADKVLKFWEAEHKYIEQWEAAHPDQEFDEDADEHKSFYSRNEVSYDAEEYENSRDRLVVREANESREGEKTKEQKAEKRRKEYTYAQEKILGDSHEAVLELITLASPELAELMGKDRRLDREVTAAMLAKDPVVTEILQEKSEELAVLTVELHRLTEFDDIYQPNLARSLHLKKSGQTIHPHAMLLSFMEGLEAEMLSMKPEDTVRGGKRLVANSAFNSEMQRITRDAALTKEQKREKMAKLNSSYYTLDEKDFSTGLVAQYADKAKREIEKFGKRVSHRTPKQDKSGTDTTQSDKDIAEKEQQDEEAETAKVVTRTKSPSTASASDMVNPSAKPAPDVDDDVKKAFDRSRGR